MKGLRILPSHKNEQGAIFIIAAVFVLFAGLGLAAFAITFSRLHVIQNEIQNAADAGAMAGAGDLLNADGSINDPGYYTTADWTVGANSSGGDPVEVVSIKRGHWSFATHIFEENNDPQLADLFSYSFAQLDVDPRFINAVEVETERTSIPSFFARILGHEGFERTAGAVAVIAPPGSFEEYEIDENIVICEEAISDPDGNTEVDCVTGRMIHSNQDPDNPGYNSGGWTNFSECENTGGMGDHVCTGGNPNPVGGSLIAVTGGQVTDALDALYDCWTEQPHLDADGDGNVEEGPDGDLDQDGDGKAEYPWNMTILVVKCPDSNPGPCSEIVGAINVDVLWITPQGTPKYPDQVPVEMFDPGDPEDPTDDDYWGPGRGNVGDSDYIPPSPDYPVRSDFDTEKKPEEAFGRALWYGAGNEIDNKNVITVHNQVTFLGSFVGHFGLEAITGHPAPLLAFAIYIKPACEWVEPTGGPGSGGGFFGVLPDRPVLVK